MTTVVDVGCAEHVDELGLLHESIRPLVARFRPRLLLGLDPLADLATYRHEGCEVRTYPVAAWNRGGTVAYRDPGIEGFTVDRKARPQVECVDLAELILERDDEIVLKLDAEGAEYLLLEHLIAQRADERLTLILVEWHGAMQARRNRIERQLACPLEQWHP